MNNAWFYGFKNWKRDQRLRFASDHDNPNYGQPAQQATVSKTASGQRGAFGGPLGESDVVPGHRLAAPVLEGGGSFVRSAPRSLPVAGSGPRWSETVASAVEPPRIFDLVGGVGDGRPTWWRGLGHGAGVRGAFGGVGAFHLGGQGQ
jgi:hypothetical protein